MLILPFARINVSSSYKNPTELNPNCIPDLVISKCNPSIFCPLMRLGVNKRYSELMLLIVNIDMLLKL